VVRLTCREAALTSIQERGKTVNNLVFQRPTATRTTVLPPIFPTYVDFALFLLYQPSWRHGLGFSLGYLGWLASHGPWAGRRMNDYHAISDAKRQEGTLDLFGGCSSLGSLAGPPSSSIVCLDGV